MATPAVYQSHLLQDEEYTESDQYLHHERWLLKQTGLSTRQDLSMLVKLDLPRCNLTRLPDNLASMLPNLEILFCPQNNFPHVPAVIGECPKLRMVSFKECQTIETIPPEALQPQLKWLILTGNRLKELPETIGRCTKLQKLMLSGNQLQRLPSRSMANLRNLELVRLACNQLEEPPTDVLQSLVGNLRWAAFASNPFLNTTAKQRNEGDGVHAGLEILDDPSLEDTQLEILGRGAGGITRKAYIENKNDNNTKTPVAVKTFAGEITSDGSPQDEKAISVAAASLNDDALIRLLGQTKERGALVMEFLQGYEALAGPPSFQTCSRDVYPDDVSDYVTPEFGWKICMNMLRVLNKLHNQLGICHADFYAHNILINTTTEDVKLSDFGAAFFYDTNSEYGKSIQRIELGAYTVLVEELFQLLAKGEHKEEGTIANRPWKQLLEECQKDEVTFDDLVQKFITDNEEK